MTGFEVVIDVSTLLEEEIPLLAELRTNLSW
jgi:hypothetical protein